MRITLHERCDRHRARAKVDAVWSDIDGLIGLHTLVDPRGQARLCSLEPDIPLSHCPDVKLIHFSRCQAMFVGRGSVSRKGQWRVW